MSKHVGGCGYHGCFAPRPVHADEESHEEVLAEQSDVELGTAQRDEIQVGIRLSEFIT